LGNPEFWKVFKKTLFWVWYVPPRFSPKFLVGNLGEKVWKLFPGFFLRGKMAWAPYMSWYLGLG